MEFTYSDRDQVTEERRYSDSAGTTLVGKQPGNNTSSPIRRRPGGQVLIPALTTMDIAESNYVSAVLSLAGPAFNLAKAGMAANNVAHAADYLISAERVRRYDQVLQRAIAAGRSGKEVGELSMRIEMMRKGYLRVGGASAEFNKAGHGIDAVFKNVRTGEIAIVEAKFCKGFNKNWSAEALLSRGYGHQQMSHEWIRECIKRSQRETSLRAAQRIGALLEKGYDHRIIVVTNEKGQVFWKALGGK